MKHRLLAYTVLPVLGLGLWGGLSVASAHGLFFGNATPEEIATRQQSMFSSQAELLGISVDEVKDAWAAGKTLKDLAAEKGISDEVLNQKIKDAQIAKLTSYLQTLVNQGVITQAQADKRLEVMKAWAANRTGHMMRGFHHQLGF